MFPVNIVSPEAITVNPEAIKDRKINKGMNC